MSEMLAKGVAKQMLAQALTKKTAFQVAKKVLKYFGITLTKSLAAKGVANSIKLLGGVLVGGITFVTLTIPANGPNPEPNTIHVSGIEPSIAEVIYEAASEIDFK